MKLLDIIKEQRELSSVQNKKIRNIHTYLKSGKFKTHFRTLNDEKTYEFRYQLPDTFEPFITPHGLMGIEYTVDVTNEEKPDFPTKIWLIDPEQGEILLNDRLTKQDIKRILYGSNESGWHGWERNRTISHGRLYLKGLEEIYDRFRRFNIFVNMFPKED